MTTQTYVADHRAQLLAEARHLQVRNHRHNVRRLFSWNRRPASPVAPQATLATQTAH